MSVTFTCPEAPVRNIPCRWCGEGGEWLDKPDLLDERGRCDPWCRGIYPESESPEINFSNVNAANILRLLDLYDPDGPWGTLSPEEIPEVLQRMLVVLNSPEKRAHLVESGYNCHAHEPRMVVEDGLPTISTGCRVIYGGNTDGQTVRRLRDLRNLLTYAVQHGYAVSWG